MSHEDAQLPEWDSDDLSGRAAMDARLADLCVRAIENDPSWPSTLITMSDALVKFDEVPEALSSATTVIVNLAILAHGGRDEAIERFKTDRATLRDIARKGAS